MAPWSKGAGINSEADSRSAIPVVVPYSKADGENVFIGVESIAYM